MTRLLLATLAVLAATLPLAGQITAPAGELKDYETLYLLFNVRKAPFDEVLVRQALTLATDRERIATLASTGAQHAMAARGLLPAYAGYAPPEHVFVTVGETQIDLLQYDPAAARLALAASSWRRTHPNQELSVEILAYSDDETKKISAALADMWQTNLGAKVIVTLMPWHDALTKAEAFQYDGVSLEGRSLLMSQPDTLLGWPMFKLEKLGWKDREIKKVLDHIGSERNYAVAARKLQAVESRLMELMPIVPLFSRAP